MATTMKKTALFGLTGLFMLGLSACGDDHGTQQEEAVAREQGFAEQVAFDINSKTGICFALYVPKDISLVGRSMEKVSCTDEVLDQVDPVKLQGLTVTPKI